MSQLRVSSSSGGDFYLNVLSFSSPIFGELNSAQTKTQVQYFPIKAFQPEIRFNVIFPSEALYEQFQTYVRDNQVDAQSNRVNPGVTLNWPQRSINNWTGVITGFKGGGMRRNYAPRAQFVVELTSSLVTELTTISSFGADWTTIFGSAIGNGVLGAVIGAVNFAETTQRVIATSGVLFGGGGSFADSAPAATGVKALSTVYQSLIPGFGG